MDTLGNKVVEILCHTVGIAPMVVGKLAAGVTGVCDVISKVLCGGGA